jgi:hypothetical protein
MTYPAGTSLAQPSGVGAVVSIGGVTGASGTETFTVIGEVADAKFSGRKLATSSTTNFDSLGYARKVGTILDFGQFTCTVERVGNDAGQLALIAANASRVAYDFKVQLPINPKIGQTTTGDLITFSGLVTEAGDFDISLTKASEYTFTIEIDGAYTVVAGS